ncbi:MAG: phosphotransferase family protein, partial [Ktedonobacterales bacterium]
YEEWQDMFLRFRHHLFPHMRPDACEAVVRRFEVFLGDDANFAYPHAVRHGDFGTSNILHDPASGTITGILDWSFVGLGDPALDVAALLASYGQPFIQRLAPHYAGLDALLPRVGFYHSTFALQEALAGAENGDLEAFERGIASYR